DPRHLDTIISNVLPAGIHVHANADLPGQLDIYGNPNPKWAQSMSSVFGLNVVNAFPAWDAGALADNSLKQPQPLNFYGVQSLGPLTNGYRDAVSTWKIWQGLTASSGFTVVSDRGVQGTAPAQPALQIKTIGAAKTAVNTFAIGDINEVATT